MFQVFNFLLSFQLVLKFCCENSFLCSCKYFLIFAIWTRDVECFTVRKFILVLHNLQQLYLNSSTQFPSLTFFEKKIQFIFREHLALQGTFLGTHPTHPGVELGCRPRRDYNWRGISTTGMQLWNRGCATFFVLLWKLCVA